MNAFEYAAPKSLKDALALLSDTWGRTEILAGGTDLVTCLKQRLTTPQRVVSLRNLDALKGFVEERGALRIGALTPLAEVAEHPTIRRLFPALVTAIEGIGSPQMLHAGTVGGDLCQRPRCWYFRNGFGLFGQRDGLSLVRQGDNRYHAIFDTDGPALFVSASSLGPPLIALGAQLLIAGPQGATRRVPAAEFFQTPKTESERETVLKPNEILTEVVLPLLGLKNATYEVRHRQGLDWPYVTASTAFRLEGGVAADARIVLGQVAPVPWPARSAAAALNGAKLDAASAARCGQAAIEGARPLSGNAYKVLMVKAAVKRAVLAAAQA